MEKEKRKWEVKKIRHSVPKSLWPHGLQHAKLPCPSPSLGAYSNSCPLSWWCHPTISSCRPLLFLPSIFPSIGSFPMNQLFASGSQSIGASTLASVLRMNIQGWFPSGLTGLISLQSKRLSRVFSSTTVQKHRCLVLSLPYGQTLTSIQDYWNNHSLTRQNFVSKETFAF